ncbi:MULTISPECIES: MetQ/NlpA family ABC transporter substrate-binding protein [Herbaspirillum]|jgi:D-methionine transport system substrate-binding protein|uniref:MetQ/NlpA family ABC transporter substrate-binding protein n=1 Tax=Herbaspirillum TaxID=963 RepID=UPI0025831889|nr:MULTISPECIES: MetQ/NlpA family ABC transporter substrate-binding protein [Herbaspirillum]MCP3657633.1 methionine-binding protein [Herbaspirillum sp.]MCP3949805.1 methionine-binding protein [Herbaspirillum sp.]MCP4035056.1 methionine-binding protein [Herbaspirillum sp.]MCP4556535.1 methionine-binding protein [Herbaspirillum sp.]MEE1637951.1 MetQ/NlpA family ABC transporter substrate-binding protein [Herbaspirillum huttiense NC40101]
MLKSLRPLLRLSHIVLLATALVGSAQAAPPVRELKLGFVPGPYIDEFKLGVQPQLEQKGYKIRYYEFSTGLEANSAVFKGDIDANVMQHSVFLASYNERNKTDLVGIVQVPTPPMGLYSRKHKSLDNLKKGFTVAVPNDPVNLQRALWILQRLGWIRIRENKPVDVTELDVVENKVGLKLVLLENAQGPRALDDADFAAIQGNFAIFAKLKLSEAFILEDMKPPYINVVAVKKTKQQETYAQDIVQAYRSEFFQKAIRSEPFYDGFTLPDYFSATSTLKLGKN